MGMDDYKIRESESQHRENGLVTERDEIERVIGRLENYYDFQCPGGPLKNCVEWQTLKEAVLRRSRAVPVLHEPPEDFDWALDRVQKMAASALADSRVYGRKLLKGFGYPNETFSSAQDWRALSILLAALSPDTDTASSGHDFFDGICSRCGMEEALAGAQCSANDTDTAPSQSD